MTSNGSQKMATISENGARQIVDQMIKLGLFHAGHHDATSLDDRFNDDGVETYRKLQKDPPPSFSVDLKCQIIPTTIDGNSNSDIGDDRRYYTQDGLIRAIVDKLHSVGNGRFSRERLSELLDVDAKYLKSEDSPLLQMLPSSVQVLGSDLVSDSYWVQLEATIQQRLQEKGGRLNLLDLASEFSLPMDVILNLVCVNLTNTSLIEGSKVLVNDTYMQEFKMKAIKLFQSLEEPTLISIICQDNSWDQALIIEWLTEEGDRIAGEIHVDPTSTATAMYLPDAYTEKRNKEILDFVAVNGYISADRASRHHGGMSFSQIKSLVEGYYPNVIQIGDDVLVLETIPQTVQSAIQEYAVAGAATTSFVDLQDYLPSELVRPDIVTPLLDQIGFCSPEEGVVVLVEDQALIVSQDVVKEINSKVMPDIVQEFAKTRAEEIFKNIATTESVAEDDEDEDETPLTSHGRKKGKSKSTRKSKRAQVKTTANDHHQLQKPIGVVPLLKVAGAVLKEYSTIFMNETVEDDLLNQAEFINWDDEENSEIVLVEFCKLALYTPDFRSKCDVAVRAELQRLHSAKQSKATVVSRKDAATKIRSAEQGFEEAFVSLCYLIQTHAKFINLASSSDVFDETWLQVLRQEFLQGWCAEFTSRLTQYCMFQNDQDDTVFTFQHPDDLSLKTTNTDEDEDGDPNSASSTTGLPGFCAVVDPSVRQRQKRSYLSCPPPREPLPVLRESLSGNLGVVLARQWILCGGECYRGGVHPQSEDQNDDGGDGTKPTMYTRPGNIDGFLSHIEENCLSLVGIPFKKLDKKSEKQFLFRRRQSLTQTLQVTSDPETVFDLTIMILFQQVKQVTVSGSLLRGPILEMLLQERKISAPVAAVLKTMKQKIQQGEPIDENLFVAVKDCGLCRDISKHEITGLPS